jgi:hypothetical protein
MSEEPGREDRKPEEGNELPPPAKKRPEPDKVWEMAVTLMAGWGPRTTPAQAVEAAIEAWEIAAKRTAEATISASRGIKLPAGAAEVWKSATGTKRSESWVTFPKQIASWSKERGLDRPDLIQLVHDELDRIFRSNQGKHHRFLDTPIMRFVVALLHARYGGPELRLCDHIRFFDLHPHRGETIDSLRHRETTIKLKAEIPDTGDFGQLAEVLSDHLNAPLISAPLGRLSDRRDAPIFHATCQGVEVHPSSGTAWEAQELKLELSSRTILLPGFAPA